MSIQRFINTDRDMLVVAVVPVVHPNGLPSHCVLPFGLIR